MLTVYKASAGSGKTFRLAVEYIKQLIIDPNSYEHVLAVTFTNKATEEMKMRILSQLYGLAHRLPDSRGYLNVIIDDLTKRNAEDPFTDRRIDENFIAFRTRIALERLLHHYNFFRVETIDRFFQTVLRNLARELDLTPNLRIELGDKEIEHEAVDNWIDSLNEHDRELGWIIDYVHSSMDEEKAWNIIGQIKTFGETLFTDEYKEHSEQLAQCFSDENFLDDYQKRLNAVLFNARKKARELGELLWHEITSHGYDVSSFAQNAKGVGAFIKRLATENIETLTVNSYVVKAYDPDDTKAEKWVTKKSTADLRDFCRETMRPMFIDAMKTILPEWKRARSAQLTLKHLSKLRLLKAIQEEIDSSNRAQDRFLLSNTQTLLQKMIDDSDSPFIFEKIGARLQSIMIDEFQDTSRIQWQNFKVLLNDCMSHGHDNLIVGDVKQSIYRFRSGDWRLLSNISNEFTQPIKEESLRVNRRSTRNIIRFNNAFFVEVAKMTISQLAEHCDKHEVEMLRNAYADVEQEVPESKPEEGYAEVHLFDIKDNEEYTNATLDYITSKITDLVTHGVKASSIAILVRSNGIIPTIVNHCLNTFAQSDDERLSSLAFVSDEAFLLEASPAVNIIVDAIRLLLNPADKVVRAQLSLNYQRHVLQQTSTHAEMLESMLLPEAFTSDMQRIATMPLYQMCEEIIAIFSLHSLSSQSAYLCCFLDHTSDYLQKSMGDISAFLTFWDETLHKKKIESDSNDGIHVLTIHKSKGLEYENIIMPFTDWKHEVGSQLLWCETEEEPFAQLPAIPLTYSEKSMKDTCYEADYWEEHLQNIADNLNVLYVALTRAKDNLFVCGRKKTNEAHRSYIIEATMPAVAKALGVECADGHLEYGTPLYPKAAADNGGGEASANVFAQQAEQKFITIHTSTTQPEFRESNQSKDFTLTDEDEKEQQQSQYIQLGNILHNLFASIRTADDIDSALLRLEMDGLLYGQDISADMLRERISASMANAQIADWFSPRWRVYNECTILEYDTETHQHREHRPDRVITNGSETIVIDFKLFSFRDKYRDQVRRYMELLRRMGHTNVRGYLWMVMSNKVVEI